MTLCFSDAFQVQPLSVSVPGGETGASEEEPVGVHAEDFKESGLKGQRGLKTFLDTASLNTVLYRNICGVFSDSGAKLLVGDEFSSLL